MSTSAAAIFAGVRAATPPNVNPFLAIAAFMTAQFYMPTPHSFDIQMHVLSGVFGV